MKIEVTDLPVSSNNPTHLCGNSSPMLRHRPTNDGGDDDDGSDGDDGNDDDNDDDGDDGGDDDGDDNDDDNDDGGGGDDDNDGDGDDGGDDDDDDDNDGVVKCIVYITTCYGHDLVGGWVPEWEEKKGLGALSST